MATRPTLLMPVGNRASSSTLRTLRTLAVLLLSIAASTRAKAEAQAPRVTRVELRADSSLRRYLDWDRLLVIRAGEPLTEKAVRRTLSNLHATGRVSDAAVYRRPVAGGVVAVVAAWGYTFIRGARLSGDPGAETKELERVLRQRAVGRPLGRALIDGAVEALGEHLRVRGYRRPTVTPWVVPRAGGGIELVCDIDPGARFTLGKLNFDGDLGSLSEDELRTALELRSGEDFDQQRIDQATERLRVRLVARGHLAARSAPPGIEDDPARQQVDLTWTVFAGPQVRLSVHGASLKKLRKKGLLALGHDAPYDRAGVRETCARLAEHFQRQGYYRVQTSCWEDPAGPDAVVLHIEIELGPRYQIASVRFVGNIQIAPETLAPLLATRPARSLRPGGGHLVDSDLEADRDNLRSYYLLHGFADVTLGPAKIEVDERKHTLGVTFAIDEGARRRVVELTASGVVSFVPELLLAGLPLVAGGGAFHPALLDESVATIRARYEQIGLPDTTVVPELSWSEDGLLVDVHFEIEEGSPMLVDRLVLRGLRRTRASLLERVVGLAPNSLISRRALLQAERDLYSLGIFSRVDVTLAPVAAADGKRDVIVHLEEGKRWRLGYGGSYHSDDGLGAVLSATRSNLRGGGSRVQLDLRANRVDQRFRLIFEQPFVTRLGLPLAYTLFFENQDRQGFSVLDRGVQIAAHKQLGRRRLGLVYEYRLVDLSADAVPGIFDDPRLGDVQISSLAPTFSIDRRDDPVEPKRGWSDFVRLTWAFKLAAARASFVELFWQHIQILGLGRAGTLAASLRLGGIEPIGGGGMAPDPLVPPGRASAAIPISERFFAGGRTSHRAFERDRLGIPGESLLPTDRSRPIGGNGLALLNLDYRFPIAGPVGGIAFFDLGNVWADWRQINLSDARPGAGLGLRYRSPIGPLRLEVGWNLDREPGESSPVFFLSFGNPF